MRYLLYAKRLVLLPAIGAVLLIALTSCAKQINPEKPPLYDIPPIGDILDRAIPDFDESLGAEFYYDKFISERIMRIDVEGAWEECEMDLKNTIRDCDDVIF